MRSFTLALLSLPFIATAAPTADLTTKPFLAQKPAEMPKKSAARKIEKKMAPQPKENTWNDARLPVDVQGFFGGAEFLIFKPSENGLDYAVKKDFAVFNASPFSDTAIDGLAGHMKHADYSWSPGLRVDVGYRTPRDALEVYGEYSWLASTNSKETVAPPSSGVQPTLAGTFPEFVDPSAAFLINRSTSRIELQYQVADLGLARRFEFSKYILGRLFATVRGAWMRRDWNVKYVCLDTQKFTKHKGYWNYDGYGAQFGFDADVYLGAGFNFFGLGGFSALYGSHGDSIKSKSAYDLKNPLQNGTLHDYRGVTGTQVQMGLAWGHAWADWSLKLFGAWEMDSWYNVAEHYRVSILPSDAGVNREKVRNLTTSTLTLAGFIAGIDINY